MNEDEIREERLAKLKELVESGDEPSAQEHLTAMFEGESLSEEGKEKITTIFEAAVQYEVEQRTKNLDEQYEQKLSEETARIESQIQEQVDAYLSEVVNEWAEKNKVEVKNKVKLDLFESFIGGLRELFIEHNINIPDEKADLAEELMGKIDSLQESVAALSRKNIRITGERDLFARELKFKEISEGLTDVQTEKLRGLIGEGEFESIEKYEAALKTIRESYFKESNVEEPLEESAPIQEEKKPDATVSIYAEMIAQAMKKVK